MKRSIYLRGKRTSVSLEDEFWEALQRIARSECRTVGEVVENVRRDYKGDNLSSAIRVHILQRYEQLLGL